MSRFLIVVGGVIVLAAVLPGCAITGLDGESKYACKAPEGVRCDSVSGTYYNALQNNLPAQRRSAAPPVDTSPQAAPAGSAPRAAPTMLNASTRPAAGDEGAAYVAAPLRAAPRVLRLWIKAWEDADRDLVGESLVYVQVDNGRWLVDHVQRQQREPFVPIRAPRPPAATKSAGAAAGPNGPSTTPTEDAPSLTQALRALQNRVPAADQ
ncbi:MAG: TraV family lipoprotein [Burkholderiaceae bacterium]|jgi:conjugal transfer pilus assembly protein TraV|nr:TraV family lipoprotein [Burkholderiaceae bacterium]